jgi:hypothetical protein
MKAWFSNKHGELINHCKGSLISEHKKLIDHLYNDENKKYSIDFSLGSTFDPRQTTNRMQNQLS